jgi:hypothetical protein
MNHNVRFAARGAASKERRTDGDGAGESSVSRAAPGERVPRVFALYGREDFRFRASSFEGWRSNNKPSNSYSTAHRPSTSPLTRSLHPRSDTETSPRGKSTRALNCVDISACRDISQTPTRDQTRHRRAHTAPDGSSSHSPLPAAPPPPSHTRREASSRMAPT